jgi:L-malate glycosyltransferase
LFSNILTWFNFYLFYYNSPQKETLPKRTMHKKTIPLSILHLLPHTGGGVGTVLRAIVKKMTEYNVTSSIAVMEALNSETEKWCVQHRIPFLQNGWEKKHELFHLLAANDIIHIHWWNHPLLQALMVCGDLPEMRTVLWSHVNGLFVPQIFYNALINFPDYFVISTSLSKKSPIVANRITHHEKIKLIQSNAGIPSKSLFPKSKPDVFQAGYIGTVDYCKMHKDLISIWRETGITESPLVICGGPSDDAFRKEVEALGVSNLFDVRGEISNVEEVFKNLHIFVYPLARNHYGTGEQVLLEAMAYGAVPVVFDNGCEKTLIEDGKTGCIVSNKEEFVKAIQFLKNNKKIRDKMALAGFDYVNENFDLKGTLQQWYAIYREVIQLPKRTHRIFLKSHGKIRNNSPASLLLNSYGDSPESELLLRLLNENERQLQGCDLTLLPPICFSRTRGSPFHYQSAFPEDADLKRICSRLNEIHTPG